MRVLQDWEEYLGFANAMLDEGPDFLYISTFGFYANVTSAGEDTSEWGEKYTNTVRKLINKAIDEKIPVRIIVGVSHSECHEGCTHCRNLYIKKLNYLNHHQKRWAENDVQIKIVTEHHMKLFLTDAGAIVGGMNFTESNWRDMSFGINWLGNGQLIDELKDEFKDAWKNSKYTDPLK